MNLHYSCKGKALVYFMLYFRQGLWTSLTSRQLLHTDTHRTYLLQTSSKKSLTVFSCLLQKSFWKLLFIQSSMLHTLTLSEYQQMVKCFKAGPRRKLSFFSSTGEWKFNEDHSKGSWNTSSNLWHVFARFFLLFLSRKEKRCKRHSQLSWVMCIAAVALCLGLVE